MSAKGAGGGLLERIAGRIPDPVVIFLAFYVVAFVVSVAFGGTAFSAKIIFTYYYKYGIIKY